MLRNHIKTMPEPEARSLDQPITRKQVWDWVAIIRWALPGIVVAGLWVWNTSAVSASREIERKELVVQQRELVEATRDLTENINTINNAMTKWITTVEGHEKRLDKLEAK